MITNKIHNSLIESIICVVDSLEEQDITAQNNKNQPLRVVNDPNDTNKKSYQANLNMWKENEKDVYNTMVNHPIFVPAHGTGMSQINADGVGRGSGKAQYMQGTRWVQNRQGLRNVQAMGNKIGGIPSQIGIRSQPGRSNYIPPSATTINATTIPPPLAAAPKTPQGFWGTVAQGAQQVGQAWVPSLMSSGSPNLTVSNTTTNYNPQTYASPKINQSSTYYPRSGARTGGAYR